MLRSSKDDTPCRAMSSYSVRVMPLTKHVFLSLSSRAAAAWRSFPKVSSIRPVMMLIRMTPTKMKNTRSKTILSW